MRIEERRLLKLLNLIGFTWIDIKQIDKHRSIESNDIFFLPGLVAKGLLEFKLLTSKHDEDLFAYRITKEGRNEYNHLV